MILKQTIMKKYIYIHNIRMINLPLNELKLIAKSRRIKGYKSMSKKGLLNALNKSESVESEKNFDDVRIKKIKKDF